MKLIDWIFLQQNKRVTVTEDVHIYSSLMATFLRMGEIDNLAEYVKQAQSLLSRLDHSKDCAKGINDEELHFGWTTTEYPMLDQVYN